MLANAFSSSSVGVSSYVFGSKVSSGGCIGWGRSGFCTLLASYEVSSGSVQGWPAASGIRIYTDLLRTTTAETARATPQLTSKPLQVSGHNESYPIELRTTEPNTQDVITLPRRVGTSLVAAVRKAEGLVTRISGFRMQERLCGAPRRPGCIPTLWLDSTLVSTEPYPVPSESLQSLACRLRLRVPYLLLFSAAVATLVLPIVECCSISP
ncbi:hypothetical protein BDV98DRAFT_261585 [Pterulicium gracile]|uniref:Uncharacterized protein n=1 Tax=Pterulicium gracile TaxID=1884261 RepID=A0A5C3Q5Z3_9AGAR|nr:hypothetical protein BDV98DRAFT_261585 [Pterula gracilis]